MSNATRARCGGRPRRGGRSRAGSCRGAAAISRLTQYPESVPQCLSIAAASGGGAQRQRWGANYVNETLRVSACLPPPPGAAAFGGNIEDCTTSVRSSAPPGGAISFVILNDPSTTGMKYKIGPSSIGTNELLPQ